MNSLGYLESRLDGILAVREPTRLRRWIAKILSFIPIIRNVGAKPRRPSQLAKRPSGKTRRSTSRGLPRPSFTLSTHGRKTLVLDLDETLIHSMSRPRLGSNHMVEVLLTDAQPVVSAVYYVDKRPYCDYFLEKVSEWYDVVVFTASLQTYADPMIDWLEQGKRIFRRRFYRSDCIQDKDGEGYIKDLSVLGDDLARIVLVDNSPTSYALQRYNGIGVEGWISDPSDSSLLHLLPLLEALRLTSDVRSVLCLRDGDRAIARSQTEPQNQPIAE